MPSLPAAVAAVFSATKLTPLPTPLLLLPLLLMALPTALPPLRPLPTALPQLPYQFSIILFLSNFTHLFLSFFISHHQELIGCDYSGGVARDSIAIRWRWVFWRGSDVLRSCLPRDGDCPDVIWLCSGRLILSRMHAVVIRHGFDGIGFWCWGIVYPHSI